jgi:hypothetical protein
MNQFLAKLRALFRKEKLDRDMAEEMRFHLAQRATDHVEDGMSPDEARYAAQRRFGNLGSLQERAREQRGFIWLEQFAQDFRYAARQLRRNPGFTVVAVLTFAIGIGAKKLSYFSRIRASLQGREFPLFGRKLNSAVRKKCRTAERSPPAGVCAAARLIPASAQPRDRCATPGAKGQSRPVPPRLSEPRIRHSRDSSSSAT